MLIFFIYFYFFYGFKDRKYSPFVYIKNLKLNVLETCYLNMEKLPGFPFFVAFLLLFRLLYLILNTLMSI